jgi:hypothetical protein
MPSCCEFKHTRDALIQNPPGKWSRECLYEYRMHTAIVLEEVAIVVNRSPLCG